MTKTIKDYFETLPQNEDDLVIVSDEIWKLGSLKEIKEKVSPELFTAHVIMNIIGNWQSDRWEGIINYHPDLFPYVSQALTAIKKPDIKEAFVSLIELFPNYVLFENGGADVDVFYNNLMNFLADDNFEADDERLKKYSKEEHAQLCLKFNNQMEILEDLSDSLYDWDSVINYISENYDA